MKQISITLLLISVGFSAMAQRMELSFLGGGNYAFLKTANSPTFSEVHNVVSPYGSLKFSYLLKGFKFGARVDVFKSKMNGTLPFTNYLLNSYQVKGSITFLDPVINPMIFLERDFYLGNKFNYFIGVNVGLLHGLKSVYTQEVYNGNMDIKKSSTGYSVGIQTGLSFAFSKQLSLILEVAPKFIKITTLGMSEEFRDLNFNSLQAYDDRKIFNTLSLPLAIGVSFKL